MYRDGCTGAELDSKLVREARELEAECMHKLGVHREATQEELEANGRKLIPVRWLDINKGDAQKADAFFWEQLQTSRWPNSSVKELKDIWSHRKEYEDFCRDHRLGQGFGETARSQGCHGGAPRSARGIRAPGGGNTNKFKDLWDDIMIWHTMQRLMSCHADSADVATKFLFELGRHILVFEEKAKFVQLLPSML